MGVSLHRCVGSSLLVLFTRQCEGLCVGASNGMVPHAFRIIIHQESITHTYSLLNTCRLRGRLRCRSGNNSFKPNITDMKKSLLTLAIAFVLGVASASATCWRINPSPYAGAQFKTVADAMNDINVLPGDTLLLDPGKHESFALQRNNMTVIGSGYFLDKNKDWAETQATIITNVTLSEGSKIEGCDVSSLYLKTGCIASRCKSDDISSSPSFHSTENALITQCYTGQIYLGKNCIARNNIVTYYVGGNDGCVFENNIVLSGGHSSYRYCIIGGFTNSTLRNNILINTQTGFDGDQKPYSTYIFNTGENNVIQNNVFSIPERFADSTIPNNLFVGATVENTFVNEGSEDAKWQLLKTSAAKGAATHGGDCGAFGGPTPYVLSGIPQFLPHITEALIPAKPTDGKITVKLKIANQNE